MFIVLEIHNLPGPPPLRSVTGRGRYGLSNLSPEQTEKVRIHTLVCLRVAAILEVCTDLKLPWMFETAAIYENQVSVANLDEYRHLMSRPGVLHKQGVQCPFGALSAKLTSWVYFRVDIEDMPGKCPHDKKIWFSDMDNTAVTARPPPTTGKETFSREQRTKSQMRAWTPKQWISTTLAAYPRPTQQIHRQQAQYGNAPSDTLTTLFLGSRSGRSSGLKAQKSKATL